MQPVAQYTINSVSVITLIRIDGPVDRPYNDRIAAGGDTRETPAPVLASYDLVVEEKHRQRTYWAEVRKGARPGEYQIDWADELSELFAQYSPNGSVAVNQAIVACFTDPSALKMPIRLA